MKIIELLNKINDLKSEYDAFRNVEHPKVLEALAIEYTYESNRIEPTVES